jgi:uncharacterized protein YcnI
MKPFLLISALLLTAASLEAQVAINPTTTTPAAWERFVVRVINQTDTPTVAVQVEVPSALAVLGIEPKAGWSFETTQKPDSGPTVITWRGGTLKRGEFGEFPFLGRTRGDAKQEVLVFPVKIERANGSSVEWRKGIGEDYQAPRAEIVGSVTVSPSATIMVSALALGVAMIALVVAIAKKAAPRA